MERWPAESWLMAFMAVSLLIGDTWRARLMVLAAVGAVGAVVTFGAEL